MIGGRGRFSIAALALLALTVPLPALAHGSIPGINQFYNGLLHPLLAPAHLLSLLALALWTGQQPLMPRPWALVGLMLGLVIGAVAARWAGDPDTDRVLLAWTLLHGAAAALAWRAPALLRGLSAALLGVWIGLGSADVTLQGGARIAALLGSGLGAILLVAETAVLVEALAVTRQWAWARIGSRVIASWLCAVAALMLALAAR